MPSVFEKFYIQRIEITSQAIHKRNIAHDIQPGAFTGQYRKSQKDFGRGEVETRAKETKINELKTRLRYKKY